MLLNVPKTNDASLYALRRKDLLTIVKQEYSDCKNGAIVLYGGFEHSRFKFRQESSFYYFTGITEPGSILKIDFDGKSTVYVPNSGSARSAWVHTPVPLVQENAKKLGFDVIKPLGDLINGYQFQPLSDKKYYNNLIGDLQTIINQSGKIFTLLPENDYEYIEQRNFIARLNLFINGFVNACVDISAYVAILRRKKDLHEIEKLYKAVEITILAHGAAAQSIRDGITECEIQASLEYMFTGSCAVPAFPSIVAAGKNGTILHYHSNKEVVKNGQLVVVDIGAELEYYCADLTRTYPVSGSFTKRQRELYNLVLDTQTYIADIAKPGMWLSNKEKPEKSLHHLAKKFLDDKGYGKYFIHGIGHFLGMDVHDVGDLKQPLQDGDVFTIEPGIYIPEENIGIRIEDDYWMAKDGIICLSESLPKKIDDIEQMMQEDSDITDFNEDLNEDESDDQEEESMDLAQG